MKLIDFLQHKFEEQGSRLGSSLSRYKKDLVKLEEFERIEIKFKTKPKLGKAVTIADRDVLKFNSQITLYGIWWLTSKVVLYQVNKGDIIRKLKK